MKGQIIGGNFSEILVRQKSDSPLEIGELLICESKDNDQKMLFQVFDLEYKSQLSSQNIELVSGMQMEEESDITFFDENTRNYVVAKLKNLLSISKNSTKISKNLPQFFSHIRTVKADDLIFLQSQKNPLFLGKLRSGSHEIDFNIFIDGVEALTHHILVAATTGKGKSNLVKSMLWNLIDKDYAGILVLDPHDEYFGRNTLGLCIHPESKRNLVYYTPKNAPAGTKTLKINLKSIKPKHFDGVILFSQPQEQAMYTFYREYRENWVEAAILEKPVPKNISFHEDTINVLRRNLINLLNVDAKDNHLICHGIFDSVSGETTVNDIISELESAKKVVVDTSSFSGPLEIFVGSIILTEVFRRYRAHKSGGSLSEMPAISVVLEEAPRVLGKAVLERGQNIFSTIAREGRKFKIGLLAITQLPSLIPRDILANINTKIILGMEMRPERESIIDSAAQDLSSDDRNIASLDKGEAIVTSTFVKFATPIKIPLFENFAKVKKVEEYKPSFSGVSVTDALDEIDML